MEISEKIKNLASQIGFDKVGFSSPKIDEIEIKNLSEWFARKYDASMSWMKRGFEKRISPEKILPGVQTVISVALNYFTDSKHSASKNNGKISRYAWGTDYHLILEEKLNLFKKEIEKLEPASKNKIYVDTGPVMEKYFSQKSGIGWRGKHTNVISKDLGSWIFLGEVLTSLKLNYDTPMEDFCGTCRACIDACPTSAIVSEYLLDSNNCISYLTIEHKGEYENNNLDFKNWIYGCDICQEVCPWNSFQKETLIEEFQPRKNNVSPDLSEILKMDLDEFKKRYSKSPIKRTKLDGIKRNAKYIISQNSENKL